MTEARETNDAKDASMESSSDSANAPPSSKRTEVISGFHPRGEGESAVGEGHGASPSIPVPPPGAAPDPYVGTTIDGRYKIEAVLGEGGMGVVYLARHKAIGKKMAIKVLRAEMARSNGELTSRFLQEAQAASSIGNPHIIDISDFGELPDGSTYFVMEHLEGLTLSKVLEQSKPLPVDRICHIAKQIADGVAAAHRSGIVHRDLKPDNIFLIRHGTQEDFVKILDFGIAKVSTSGGSKLTRAGAIFGTPHYMSPEQAAGSTVDSRTDIYALGVILYEMASGQVPFDADNYMGILTQHMYKAPVPIRALVPARDVPPGLEAIILKCLSKKPEHRYQTMEELIADFDKLTQGQVPDAVAEMMARSGSFNVPADFFTERGMPGPVPATPPELRKRKPWGIYAGVAGVLAAVGIVVAIFAQSSSGTASPSPPVQPVARAPEPAPTPVPSPTPAPAPEPSAAPQPAAEAPPQPKLSRVLFATEPLDAVVFRGDEELGSGPLTIEVAENQPVEVEVRREGYKTKKVTVDGSEERMTVKLEKKKVQAPAKAPRRKAPSGSGLGTTEIVNPWR